MFLSFDNHPLFTTKSNSPIIITNANDDTYNYLFENALMKRHQMLKINESKRQEVVVPLSNNEDRVHATSEQWAKLVDWLFEIVSVLDKSSRSVFMAMGYIDMVISNTKVRDHQCFTSLSFSSLSQHTYTTIVYSQ